MASANIAEWDTFYVIIGSSAGALVGLQFVVLTLIAEKPVLRVAEAGAAFVTPTIIHFCAVLMLSAVVRAPWQRMTPLVVIWAAVGVAGLIYTVIVARRLRTQTVYKPVWEDWLCHVLLPFAGYGLLALTPLTAFTHADESLFGVATAALLLLFVGIHNAWDTVSYPVFVGMDRKDP